MARSPIPILVLAACGTGTPSAVGPGAPSGMTIGGPCAFDSDCPHSYECDKDDPGGECTKRCASSTDCGPGGACTSEKECLASCQTNADCKRPGYVCTGKVPDSYCDIPEAAEKH